MAANQAVSYVAGRNSGTSLVLPPQGRCQFLILLISPAFSAAHGQFLSNRIHGALLERCYSFPRQEISSLSKHFSEPTRTTVEKFLSKPGVQLADQLKRSHSAVCTAWRGKTCIQRGEKKMSAGLSARCLACNKLGSNGSLSSSHCIPQTFHCKSGLTEWQSTLPSPLGNNCAAPFCQCGESRRAINSHNSCRFKPWESEAKAPSALQRA